MADKKSPVTVSTIKEAEALVGEGYTNILYAVGITESKLTRVKNLNEQGSNVIILIDSLEQAISINKYCVDNGCCFSVLIEVDCDGHRGGIKPNSPLLVQVAKTVQGGSAEFVGVLAHAGESYSCFDKLSLQTAAQNEVEQTRLAVSYLFQAGIPCKIVSIGSTPTAHNYQDLEGITEVRAGVYTFFDLVMAGTGVCDINDIAATVVTTVIGHNREQGWLFVDAGWMALSADRGTEKQPNDCGYGLVTTSDGTLQTNLRVVTVNQEHGIIASTEPNALNPDDFPIGTRLHILPNHACATASMHSIYHVFDELNNSHEVWTRIQGW